MSVGAGSITLYRIAGADANAKDAASVESWIPRSAANAPTGGKLLKLKGFEVRDEVGDIFRIVLVGEAGHAVSALFNLGRHHGG